MIEVEAEMVVLEKCFRQSVIIVVTIAKSRLGQVVKNQFIAATVSIKRVIEEDAATVETIIDRNAVSEIRVHDLIDLVMTGQALMPPVTIAARIARFLSNQLKINQFFVMNASRIIKTWAKVMQAMPLKHALKA